MERVAVTVDQEDEMVAIKVADHARSPGGRFIKDGPFSGEWFRNKVLAPALREAIDNQDVLEVELDGTSGYGSSFLEEAFGGLIRTGLVSPNEVKTHLRVVANSLLFRPYAALADRYIREAKPELVVA